YGVPLQGTAPATDFVYAGMFYNADSGLYLTNYRAYDPVAGRWLSRDPIGEVTDPTGNLYPYVSGAPVSLRDPSGLIPGTGPIPLRNSCAVPRGWNGGSGAPQGALTVPPLPEDLVGTQDKYSGPKGNRHVSGPLDPSNGGTGNAQKDFDKLTGGQSAP